MKAFWGWLLVAVAGVVYSQTGATPADPGRSQLSMADFGLLYPLSADWVRATKLLRRQLESSNSPQNFDVLLAAVYVPKANLSGTSPFFSVYAYRQPAADCKKSFEAMIARSQGDKDSPQGGVKEFSAAGRDYFRLNLAPGVRKRHQCMICTKANGHILVWNAGADSEKGLEAIVSTLSSITSLPQRNMPESSQSTVQKNASAEKALASSNPPGGERIKVVSGVTQGLLIKRVSPVYPADARAAYIQGTVVLQAEISKTGDITDLELIDGPIELAGSAVAAVRQWKYKPYLLLGEPVMVDTQIQVNYQLRP
jgi:TonB family protein